MKTLILNGSPRPNGDTSTMIHALTSRIHGECKVYDCYHSSISPCVDCRCCRKQLFCPIDDEMQALYADLAECDNLILASPVHYAELSSGLLKVASRFQVYSSALLFRHEALPLHIRRGAVLLAQGGSGGAQRAYETARLIFQGLGVAEVYPMLCSEHTDRIVASEDGKTLQEIEQLAEWVDSFEAQQKILSEMP